MILYYKNRRINQATGEITMTDATPALPPGYTRIIRAMLTRAIEGDAPASVIVDVYDVFIAFNVTCPATAHAIKKLLCAGQRGHKSRETDLQEAITAINRAVQLDRTHTLPTT